MVRRRKTIAAIAWYRREDYPAVVELMRDHQKMLPTYDEWLTQARRIERQTDQDGRPLARIYVRAKDFAAWCEERRRVPHTFSLKDYVRESAEKLHASFP